MAHSSYDPTRLKSDRNVRLDRSANARNELPLEEDPSPEQAESFNEDFRGGYVSNGWNKNLEWRIGFTRGVCKVLYGDPIPNDEQNPIYVVGQKPGGLLRVTGYYGDDFTPELTAALEEAGFESITSGKVTVLPKSQSKGQNIPRGVEATTAMFSLRPPATPYWRPEKTELHRLTHGHFVVGDGYFEVNLHPDMTRITPHGLTVVEPPVVAVALPKDLAGIEALALSLGLKVLKHAAGTIIKEAV